MYSALGEICHKNGAIRIIQLLLLLLLHNIPQYYKSSIGPNTFIEKLIYEQSSQD